MAGPALFGYVQVHCNYLRDVGDDLCVSEALVVAHVTEHSACIEQETLWETNMAG